MKAVYLHGFGADSLSWAGTMGALNQIENHAVDLPGHGSALDMLNDGSLADLAEGVLQGIADAPPAWLVGHSLGGGIALWLAAHYPERWKGLALMAPLGLGQRVDIERLETYPDTEDQGAMMGFLESLVHDKSTIKPEFATYALSQLERPGGRDALRRIAAQMPRMARQIQSLLPRVAQSGLDVRVFWGKNDNVAQARCELIRDCGSLVQLPEVGHIVHVEAMATINGHLRKLFRLV